MSYESQGIFTEGRTFDLGQETSCCAGESSKSKGRTRKKNGPFADCCECGERYQWTHKSSGEQYCGITCGWNAKRRFGNERAKCLACHALVGMTCRASGKMVNMPGGGVSTERTKRGIKGGGYALATAVAHIKRMAGLHPQAKNDNHNRAIKQWMSDEWGNVVECYWGGMLTPDVDRIVMMGDGFDASGMSKAMLWYYRNHEKSKAYMANYASARYHASKGDEIAIVRRKLRNHIHRVCRKSKSGKTRRTIDYLGCTILEARAHLQRQFKRGMTWENHGEVWEIDHIVPMSHFDLMDESHRMRVNHFTNLQPLFKAENRMKGDRLLVSHQLALI